MTTYKKIDLSVIPPEISIGAAKELIDHRIAKKSPLIQSSFERLIKKALKPNSIGLTPDQAIQETVDAGWKDINFDWLAKRVLTASQSGLTRNRTIHQQLKDNSWAQ